MRYAFSFTALRSAGVGEWHSPLRVQLLGLLLALGLAGCNAETRTDATTAKTTTPPPSASPFTIRHPEWAAHASLYEVNVRQYTPEGTFRAFEKHLPRLQQMGVGILWLMPIHPIGQQNRKGKLGSYYSVRDYRAVNPDFGTMDDLRHLVREAHGRGMHVILDWVANHTAWDNPLVREHPDWFTRDAAGTLVPPVADWQDVVDLDYSKPALQRWMRESLTYWVREADVDGYRCDVAGLVPTKFWDDARADLEQIKPVFMLAEWDELHHPPFVSDKDWNPNTHLLERAFDATYALRLHGILDSVGRNQLPNTTIDEYVAHERRAYPPHVYLMNFTTSHDINSWDGTEYERLGKNALPEAVLTALLPGIPMVYSGQESALKKRLSFFEKDLIPWGDYPLQDFYTRLLQLKKNHPALANGDSTSRFQRLPSPEGTYAFTRSKGDAYVLVAVNLTTTEQFVPVPKGGGTWLAVLSPDANRALVPGTPVNVPAHGYQVFTLSSQPPPPPPAGGTSTGSTTSNKWWTYLADYEGSPGSIRVDLALRKQAPLAEYPYVVVTGPTYSSKHKEGLPEIADLKRLNDLQEKVVATVREQGPCIYVGTFTHSFEQLHYIYVKSPKGIEQALADLYQKACKGCKTYTNIKQDPTWTGYLEFLYPNDATRQQYGLPSE